MSAGIVSAVERTGAELGLDGAPTDYIQTDAATAAGSSGGPLVNVQARPVPYIYFCHLFLISPYPRPPDRLALRYSEFPIDCIATTSCKPCARTTSSDHIEINGQLLLPHRAR